MRAFMVEHVQLVGIEIHAGLDIADKGIVRPTVPQAGDHIVELARQTIARVMFHMGLAPEI